MGATNFWGTDGQYKYLHRWIKNQCGKAGHCEQSDDTCKGRFEWSNKSGDYMKDTRDWAQLCRSHHRRHDNAVETHAILQPKTHCKNGHEFTDESVRVYINNAGKEFRRCFICRKEYLRIQYLKKISVEA